MKISIAMTTCNGAKYLQKQLDSFLAQSRQPDQIVVCDDCSSDTTVEILMRFKEIAPFDVDIFKNESNLGVSRNFEKAISICSGDIIFISDQDDFWNSKKIEYVMEFFNDHQDIQVVINDAIIADEKLVPSKVSVLKQIHSFSGSTNEFIHGCCTALRKTFSDLSLPLPRVGEEVVGYDGWIHNVGVYLDVRAVLPIALQHYRRHQTNVSNSSSNSQKKVNLRDKFLFLMADSSSKRNTL